MRPKQLSEIPAPGPRRRLRFVLPFPAFVTAAITIVLITASGCGGGPAETRDDTFTVTGPPEVIVSSENGSIRVNSGPDDQVRVLAEVRDADRVQYELSQVGDTITVSVRINRQRGGSGGAPGADITITAPARTDVDLHTSNGGIELDGIEGSGSLETSNGRIVLRNVKGDFEGGTSNGRIEVETMEGALSIRSSNGAMNVQGLKGEIDVETTNGSISFSGEMTPGGNNRLVTTNGGVDVELHGTPSVNLDAETSNGKVTGDLPITATSTGDHLVGTIGDGEGDLYIRTSNGDVTIR